MRSWYMLLFQFEGVAEQYLLEGEGSIFFDGHPDGKQVRAAMSEPGALTAGLGWYRANAHPRTLVEEPVQLPAVTCPVLGIWSSNDIALTEAQMKGSEQFVDAPWRYERIDGAGHWMQLDATDRVNELLLAFLGQ
jgi:pimeloyl-ACP methyl ester carboxylesterase